LPPNDKTKYYFAIINIQKRKLANKEESTVKKLSDNV
jgi:hypothetical protein